MTTKVDMFLKTPLGRSSIDAWLEENTHHIILPYAGGKPRTSYRQNFIINVNSIAPTDSTMLVVHIPQDEGNLVVIN
jgi:hypothetical protein